MQCKEISSLVMKYFDGNVSELEIEMIMKHNDKCNRCAESFTLLKEALNFLSELPEIEVPEGFELKVMERIKTRGAYSANLKIAAFWMISVIGLIVFGWNMLVYAVLPLAKESGMFIAVWDVLVYGYNIAFGILREVIVTASVLLGKILVMRNILLRDYITYVTLMVMAFMGINLILINSRKLREN